MTLRAALRAGACAAAAVAVAAGAASGAAGARDERVAIAVHHAFGTPEHFTIEGRVAERREGRELRVSDTWLTNLWRSLRALRTDEQKGVPLLLAFGSGTWQLRSDDEGYFALRGRTPVSARPGWNPIRIEVAGGAARVEESLLVVPAAGSHGIISDFDDTVVVSEVQDRSRMLAHALLENALQRTAVPGMADLYRGIVARSAEPTAAPVVYLTGSPRQMIPAMRAFLERNGFPRGPIVAKKVSDGGDADPLLDQERYKLLRIEQILAELPGTRFVLFGDDGERDPEVYRAVRERHPDRVEGVYIRRVSRDPARPSYPGQAPPPTRDAAQPAAGAR